MIYICRQTGFIILNNKIGQTQHTKLDATSSRHTWILQAFPTIGPAILYRMFAPCSHPVSQEKEKLDKLGYTLLLPRPVWLSG